MNPHIYHTRNDILNLLNIKRLNKRNAMLNYNKIKYFSLKSPGDGYISILYDVRLVNSTIYSNIIKYFKLKYPHKKVIYKYNKSIQYMLRSKDATYDIL